MDKLLTKKDLAEHWQVSLQTINNYITDGVLSPIKVIPSVRFNPQYIAKLEGTELSPMSPLERRRLKRELDEWKSRAQKAEKALMKVNIDIMDIIYTKANEA